MRRPIGEFMTEVLSKPDDKIVVRLITHLFENHARPHFTAQLRPVVFDEVISDAWADHESIVNISNAVLSDRCIEISVPAVRYQPVVLKKAPIVLDRGASILTRLLVISIRGIRTQEQFILVPLFDGQ